MKFLALNIFIFLTLVASAQHRITGYLYDATNGEMLINATVFESEYNIGTLTNNDGFFTINLPEAGLVNLSARYVGYSTQSFNFYLKTDSSLIIKLIPGVDLEEVSVKSNQVSLNHTAISAIKLPVHLLNKLPSFAGESDLARVMQLMPGVQSGKEGTSSLYVRGGSPDQNLVLLDNMPVYFMNHIAGFISVFNPDAINYAELYKGAFPARYGGHLSSVLDVRMKEGDNQQFKRNFTMGTLTSRITFEGPIKKDTSSYIVSFRRSLIDLFINGFQYMNHGGDFFAGIKMWDFNAKYNYRISDKTRYFSSLYSGKDKFYMKQKDNAVSDLFPFKLRANYSNKWGNTVGAFRLNHILNQRLFLNLTAGYSGFHYNINEEIRKLDGINNDEVGNINSNHQSNIDEVLVKIDLNWSLTSKHQLEYGINLNRTRFSPSKLYYEKNDLDEDPYVIWNVAKIVNLNEVDFYVNDNWKISQKILVDLGLRQVNYITSDNKHSIFEPRISLTYKPVKQIQLKVAYSEMAQFIHLLTNNEASLQTDFWVPSQGKVNPESSRQFVVGFDVPLFMGSYLLTVETYYKRMKSLIENKTGSSFFDSGGDWIDYVEIDGLGKAKGFELMLNKQTGKLTGWIGYTLSKNERQFAHIDNGKWFPYKYDRTHNLSIVANYEINKHINISSNWIFMTGNAVTLPNEKFMLSAIGLNEQYEITGELWADIYPSRNNYRMPNYHRLDISANFTREVYRGIRTWSIGLYNAYNHHNPYYLFFDTTEQGQKKLYSFTLFPLLPSISYSLIF